MALIIVADDEPAVRRSLTRYLEKVGHEVVQAENGLEVIRALGGASIDLVITDINMPDMDGIEVLSAVRDADETVPVVAMSGGGLFPKDLLLDNAEMLGAFATLPKPIGLDELRRVVENALSSAAPSAP